MNAPRHSFRTFRFAVTSAMAATLLAGCASPGVAPRADASASRAQAALARGQSGKAVSFAEAAVAAAPRDANARVLLGQAYMKDGRFTSAISAFGDAMTLGDNTSRTALSLALSYSAAGRQSEAVALLDEWRDAIPASDLGLALALAGETGRGVAILADALRSGEATPKLRQNLAYAYALDGRWREARIMMSQDVPADQVSDRISQWAANARPESFHERVAAMLSVPVRADAGQPAQLALSNAPSAEQLAAEAEAPRAEPQTAAAELPAADEGPAPVLAAAPAQDAVPAAQAQPGFVAVPVVQPLPARTLRASVPVRAAARPAPAPAVAYAPRGGSHLVQLGSFSSEQNARRAWDIYTSRNPELKNTRLTITQAVVNGRNFWRVAAGGLDSGSANGLCSRVKGRGGACFAYASLPAGAPAPGQKASGPLHARRR